LLDPLANFGPQIEALIVYNSNPVAVPESGQVRGFEREDLFRWCWNSSRPTPQTVARLPAARHHPVEH
jgi:hypothetical protein